MVASFPNILDLTISVIGLAQGVFLCLLLRSEGVRAFAANRWMMVFLGGVAINLLADIGDVLVSGAGNDLIVLFFFPINFVIAPAIYLYFLEISGTPSQRPWQHFLLAGLIFNLMAWLLTVDGLGAVPPSGNLADQIAAVKGFCWFAFFVQTSLYIFLIFRVSRRYFQKAQEQLGADRRAMQRWLGVILGGVCLIFITVLISRVIAIYVPERMAMTGAGIAFVMVLFAMSYVIATQPVLFVMADWPGDIASRKTDDVLNNGGMVRTSGAVQLDVPENTARALLDDDGVERTVARLSNIHKQRDVLLDPLVSLPKLAKAVGVTPNQLSYVLNKHIGQSFFDFVNSARIEEARAVLLLEPDRTILDIALSVGFNSKSTFNLAFKKITGDTPSAVREAAKSMNGEVRAS